LLLVKFINLIPSIVFGNMGGLLFASFLAHIFGFIGPFAALGIIFLVYAIFLEKLIFFLP
jgi:hypothetical protein